MAKFLQLTLWNTSGLTQHAEELKMFISHHNINVTLISEMRFADKSYLKLPKYTVYHTNHPAGAARGGTAVIIKITIKHQLQSRYKQDFLQATSVGGRLGRTPDYFSCLSPTKTGNKTRASRRILQHPWASVHCRRRLQC
jgi:hypothetical protein